MLCRVRPPGWGDYTAAEAAEFCKACKAATGTTTATHKLACSRATEMSERANVEKRTVRMAAEAEGAAATKLALKR